MSNINKLFEEFGIDVPPILPKTAGHKRRSWLKDDDSSPEALVQDNSDPLSKLEMSISNTLANDKYHEPSKKPESKLRQTEDNLETNLGQTEDNLETYLGRTEDGLKTNIGQTEDKLKTQPRTELRTKTNGTKALNLGQTEDKLRTNKFFARLSGLQRDILLFIYDECQSVASMETPPLRIEYIAKCCKSTALSIRKTIQRMETGKQLLIRSDYQSGRSGWTQYKLHENVYQEIHFLKSTNKLRTNLGQTEDNLETQPRTELRTSVPCSSSNSLDIKTTTTELSDEWNFDITPYAQFSFTKTQIKQLAASGVISAADVEQSLIEFSYDLENNALPSIKTTKINFLMGLLWKGQSYVSEGFKNEQDAIISEMARRAAAKRESALKAKFEVWETSLTDEERQKVLSKLPTSLMVLEKTYGISNEEVRKGYFDYFLRNVKG